MHYNSFEYNERKTVMFKCSWCFLDCLWHMFRMAKLKSRSTFKHTNTRSMWSNGKWEIRWTNKFDLCDLCDSKRKTWKRHLLIKVQPIIRTISATLCKIVEFFTLRWFRAKKNRFVCRFMFIFVLHGECMYARDAITPNVQYRTKAFCMRLLWTVKRRRTLWLITKWNYVLRNCQLNDWIILFLRC